MMIIDSGLVFGPLCIGPRTKRERDSETQRQMNRHADKETAGFAISAAQCRMAAAEATVSSCQQSRRHNSPTVALAGR